MSDHVVSPRIYVAVFALLMALTAITVFVAYFDLGPLNTIAAITIACAKALFVVLYFMHVRYGGRIVWLLIGTGVLWLAILLVLLMADYASRGWAITGG